ncbi:uncharacterized protein LOC134847925 [Symsagittifera roscoffensis]|uniref:uncharacterized protein LOC134847925 n=1 Tax=Symsagittifera roscoffensis TaxID=84072 RepID=UPI00307B6A13
MKSRTVIGCSLLSLSVFLSLGVLDVVQSTVESGRSVNKLISLEEGDEDDQLMKGTQLDLYMPEENCYDLYGIRGQMHFIRNGIAMRGALRRPITLEPEVNQVQLMFVSPLLVLLFETRATIVNDSLGMVWYNFSRPENCKVESPCWSEEHSSFNNDPNKWGKMSIFVSCHESPGQSVHSSDNTKQTSKSPGDDSTYSVELKLNFTFAAMYSSAAMSKGGLGDNGSKINSRTVLFTVIKVCRLKPEPVVSTVARVGTRMKMSSVAVFLCSALATLLLVVVSTLAVSFYHLRDMKPNGASGAATAQSFKMNMSNVRGSQQQQRAALLLSGQFSESVLASQLNYRSNSSSTGGGTIIGGSNNHGSQFLPRTGGGGVDAANGIVSSLTQLQPPDYNNANMSHGLLNKMGSSNRNMFLSSANGGMVQGSPVPMEHVHPMHHALPPGGMGMGLELMNSLSPATSGFMAPMHTAANSVGGGSGPTCVTPAASEPVMNLGGGVRGSESNLMSPTTPGSSGMQHPLLPPEVVLTNITRQQVNMTEMVLQGTFGLLHNASVAMKGASGDIFQYPITVKTVKEQSSVGQIDTMLHECHVFSSVSASECTHVLPCLTVVYGNQENNLPSSQSEHNPKEIQGVKGERDKEVNKYYPPPLVVYPQTTFGILKLHLRHLRSTRQSLTTRDVVGMGIQILHGLQFIVKSKLEFNDLATRNCFLDDGWVVKIGDAALARDLFPEDYQCLGDNVNRPIKWLAIEAISKYIYSPANDVWSFGITLWELWTLAENPYEDIDPFEMVSFLKEGGRLYQPQNCPDALYRCMCSCWAYDAVERPNISKLIKYLQEFYTALGAFL